MMVNKKDNKNCEERLVDLFPVPAVSVSPVHCLAGGSYKQKGSNITVFGDNNSECYKSYW